MSINFENASLLSLSQERVNFDSDFNFKNIKIIEVSGFLIDLDNTEGVQEIFEETNNIVEVYENSRNQGSGTINKKTQEFLVNGVSYGLGYLNSFSVQGQQIQTAVYSASFEINEPENLSNIILTQNNDSTKNLGESTLEADDLKYLTQLSENFEFSYGDDNSISTSHSVECRFVNRESLISRKKDIWSGSSIQESKLAKLNNKGKGSIKVNSNTTATHSLNLDSGNYVLFFDYLGQDASLLGSCQVEFGSETKILGEVTGRKKIEFSNPSSSSVQISLVSNTASDTFFDNFELYKKDQLPLQKSRALSNFLINSSPNYSIIEGEYKEKYPTQNIFDNFSKSEVFDEVELNYSTTKEISHAGLQTDDNYSLSSEISLSFGGEGIVEITENSQIKALKSKAESDVRSYVDEVESGSYNRCLQFLQNYEELLSYECSTPTETITRTRNDYLFNKPINKSSNFNFYSGKASLNLTFSSDESYEENSGVYIHNGIEDIEELEGNYLIKLSGVIQGDGDTIDQKNTSAKNGFLDVLNGLTNRVNLAKDESDNSGTFRETTKNIVSDKFNGTISYDISFENSDAYEVHGSKIIKKYEIDVSIDNPITIFNEFTVNCSPIIQEIGNLFTPKNVVVQVSAEGFLG